MAVRGGFCIGPVARMDLGYRQSQPSKAMSLNPAVDAVFISRAGLARAGWISYRPTVIFFYSQNVYIRPSFVHPALKPGTVF
jgi:hypothetical protein